MLEQVVAITACLTTAISTAAFARKDSDDARAGKARRAIRSKGQGASG